MAYLNLLFRERADLADTADEYRRDVGNTQAYKLVKQVDPVYSPLAKQARIRGLVSGHPLLVQAAIDAVRQWIYDPTLLNGQPVEVVTMIDVNFPPDSVGPGDARKPGIG